MYKRQVHNGVVVDVFVVCVVGTGLNVVVVVAVVVVIEFGFNVVVIVASCVVVVSNVVVAEDVNNGVVVDVFVVCVVGTGFNVVVVVVGLAVVVVKVVVVSGVVVVLVDCPTVKQTGVVLENSGGATVFAAMHELSTRFCRMELKAWKLEA